MKAVVVMMLSLLFVACGTTSGIKQEGVAEPKIDFSKYDSLVVLDFSDGTMGQKMPEFAGKNFADRIYSAVVSKGVFKQVYRTEVEAEENSLILSGKVTRYVEGNAALRFMVGFGAGSSYFDAMVDFTDATTKEGLGEVVVDKNSWGLGGGLASGQTVEVFMNEAAQKIADELEKAKTAQAENVALKK